MHPGTFPALAVGYLLLAYLGVLLVDMFQLGNGQAWLAESTEQGLLWHHLFRDKGPTDVFHWALLAGIVITGGILAGRLGAGGQMRASRFWLLMAVTGAILMVDAAASFRLLTYFTTRGLAIGSGHPIYTATLVIHYGVMAIVPVYALTRYRDVVWKTPAMRWLVSGLVVYAVLILLNIMRRADDWYLRGGQWFTERYPGLLYHPPGVSPPASQEFLGLVLNGSAQLLAASFLIAALFAYKRSMPPPKTLETPHPKEQATEDPSKDESPL